MSPGREIPQFASEQDAFAWMHEQLEGEDCVDNHRFAFQDDPEARDRYEDQSRHGCCGSYEAEVLVAGRPAWIGCNYGH